jgi:hypothetical protein
MTNEHCIMWYYVDAPTKILFFKFLYFNLRDKTTEAAAAATTTTTTTTA